MPRLQPFVVHGQPGPPVGWLRESWGDGISDVAHGQGYTFTGNNRAYLAQDPDSPGEKVLAWMFAKYSRLELLDKELSFEVDLSGVGCGCVGTVYLVDMGEPIPQGAQYCDILHEECTPHPPPAPVPSRHYAPH